MAAVILRAISANLEFLDLYFSQVPVESDFMTVLNSMTQRFDLRGHQSFALSQWRNLQPRRARQARPPQTSATTSFDF